MKTVNLGAKNSVYVSHLIGVSKTNLDFKNSVYVSHLIGVSKTNLDFKNGRSDQLNLHHSPLNMLKWQIEIMLLKVKIMIKQNKKNRFI